MEKLTWLFVLWIALVVGAYLILKFMPFESPTPTLQPIKPHTGDFVPSIIGGLLW